MSEIEYIDVRRKQIECLVNVLQSAGQQLTSDQWPTVIETVRVVVAGKLRLLLLRFRNFISRLSECYSWISVSYYEIYSELFTPFSSELQLELLGSFVNSLKFSMIPWFFLQNSIISVKMNNYLGCGEKVGDVS